jgi:hypothetical protein
VALLEPAGTTNWFVCTPSTVLAKAPSGDEELSESAVPPAGADSGLPDASWSSTVMGPMPERLTGPVTGAVVNASRGLTVSTCVADAVPELTVRVGLPGAVSP